MRRLWPVAPPILRPSDQGLEALPVQSFRVSRPVSSGRWLARSLSWPLLSGLLLLEMLGGSALAAQGLNRDVAFESGEAGGSGVGAEGPRGLLSRRVTSLDVQSQVLPPARVVGQDARWGAPSLLLAGPDHPRAPAHLRTPEEAAAWYLEAERGRYGLGLGALEAAEPVLVHDTGRGGILVVFRQRMGGVETFRADAKVLLAEDFSLVAMGGALHPAAYPGPLEGRMAFLEPAAQAVTQAFLELYAVSLPRETVRDRGPGPGGYTFYEVESRHLEGLGLSLTEPARARPVLYPLGDRLEPAYFVELLVGPAGGLESEAFALVVSARDGRVLFVQDERQDAAYRVWTGASGDYRPAQGPQADYFPHPSGKPDNTNPAYVAPTLVSLDGFNDSPDGQGDPWLPASATETSGNNVDAYADLTDPDGFSSGDLRASMTAPGVFDRVYNTAQEPLASQAQSMAAITQLFYSINWLHDWYYDSGFNEAAGNAQLSNYGRGGVEGDPMKAEGQDTALNASPKLNNANMTTRYDGASPRMQMYLWSPDEDKKLTITPLALEPTVGVAAFGPGNFDVTGVLSTVVDDAEPVGDGCTALKGSLTGKVALVDRGNCTFELKSINAAAAGAIGVVIVNNKASNGAPGMADDTTVVGNTPILSISLEDGDLVKAAMASGTQTARLYRKGDVKRDANLDGSVVSHEWGHYLHKRLTACSTQQCNAESEGWADFVALHMGVGQADALNGTYGMGIYAGAYGGDSGYYGIRRFPYSIDFTKNPLTFKHIMTGEPLPTTAPMAASSSSNAEVHNAGEVWASMLWEAYAGLLQESQGASARLTFAEAQRRFADYVVLGMLLAPVEPTFTEQRDALLAAAGAADAEDMQVLAEGFARRGAGTCAVSPARTSTDLTGVVESYELASSLSLTGMRLTDEGGGCDGDGILDGGETGQVVVTLWNAGTQPLDGATLSLTSSSASVGFPGGGQGTLGPVDAMGSGEVRIPVFLADGATSVEAVSLSLSVLADEGCVRSLSSTQSFRVNADELTASSATETVESSQRVWSAANPVSFTPIWGQLEKSALSHAFYGVDQASPADGRLESPELQVSPSQPLVVSFTHRYQFEASVESGNTALTYWDGGVIEISLDGGGTWVDVSTYANPAYGGTLTDKSGNVLMNRRAYVDKNAGYPAFVQERLELGTQLAGQTIRLRFRLGTDQASGGYGWEIDDIVFTGLTNTPFSSVVADATAAPDWYTDADGDGLGDSGSRQVSCVQPSGTVAEGGDCLDQDPDSQPGAVEVCDRADNDCNGMVDDAPVDGVTAWPDGDGDGFGSAPSASVCPTAAGYSSSSGDCDDGASAVFPGAAETCNGRDDDCDGQVDDAATDAQTYYADQDGDGFGDASQASRGCQLPAGASSLSGDCADRDASVYPGADEVCDGVDEDCDGRVDEEARDAVTVYADEDGDGYGDPEAALLACSAQTGQSLQGGDCLDADPAVSPEGVERCDGVDEDCDGQVDEEAVDMPTWYADGDGDGFGETASAQAACQAPVGSVSQGGDCQDGDPSVYPGAPEQANGVDQNCDGSSQTPAPEVTPTSAPSPTLEPSPTLGPTLGPTAGPTLEPTADPTLGPTLEPTALPTVSPTVLPTVTPTVAPTLAPTPTQAGEEPTASGDTSTPTASPSSPPESATPTQEPTALPTDESPSCGCDQHGGRGSSLGGLIWLAGLGGLLRWRSRRRVSRGRRDGRWWE